MKRNYITNVNGINVDPKAMKRLIVLNKSWLKKAQTAKTSENKEAIRLIKKGCFFVDGTNYSVKHFSAESNGHLSNPLGQSLNPIYIPN